MSLRPSNRDVAVTLRVVYANRTPIVGTARFAGYTVPPVDAPERNFSDSNKETEALRRRVRELEDANAALRRHVFGWDNSKGAAK